MNKIIGATTLAAALFSAALAPARAASGDDFKTAYAAADATEKQAGTLRNQWTSTEAALAAARKAAEAGNFDEAVAQAKEAEALAKASIYQAESERRAWKALAIH